MAVETPRVKFASTDDAAISSMPRFDRTDLYAVLALAAIAVAASIPFFYAARGNMPVAHDLPIHWVRMIAFDEVLRSGVLYPRWLASLNNGYGAATTLYYAPGVYYSLSAAHSIGGEWARAIEVVVLASAAMSAAGCYLYARLFLAARGAIAATVLYTLQPYKLIDLYHRGALAELLALALMPFIAASLTIAIRRGTTFVVLGAALFAVLVLTHPPAGYLFAVSIGILTVTASVKMKTPRPVVLGFLILVGGAGFSAFYWLPAYLELPLAKQAITSTFNEHPGYLTSLLVGDRFERLIAAIAIATLLLSAYFFWFVLRSRALSISVRWQAWSWAVTAIMVLMLMMPWTGDLARLVPGLSGTGFLWRALTIQVLATAIAGGMFTECFSNRVVSSGIFRLGTICAAAVLLFGAVASSWASNLRIELMPPAAGMEEAFTPVSAPPVSELNDSLGPIVVTGCSETEIRIVEWKPQTRSIEAVAPIACVLEVHTFNFPGWTASVDGVRQTLYTEPHRGTVLLNVAPGRHRITLAFGETPTRRNARLISLSFIAMYGALLIVSTSLRKITRLGARRAEEQAAQPRFP